MNKASLVSVTVIILAMFGLIFLFGSNKNENKGSASVGNSEIRAGVQYVTIQAGGGYSPKLSSAKAGIPTKLIMKTNGVYDCSSYLVIHSIGFKNILPQTGETEIDIGTPKVGESIQGVCGMGMYSFVINFK